MTVVDSILRAAQMISGLWPEIPGAEALPLARPERFLLWNVPIV